MDPIAFKRYNSFTQICPPATPTNQRRLSTRFTFMVFLFTCFCSSFTKVFVIGAFGDTFVRVFHRYHFFIYLYDDDIKDIRNKNEKRFYSILNLIRGILDNIFCVRRYVHILHAFNDNNNNNNSNSKLLNQCYGYQ